MASPRLPIGLVQVYTGDGKGKTTAALGLALRALGAGLRVAFFQFIKGGHDTSELAMAARLGPRFWPRRFATSATAFSMGRGAPTDEDGRAVCQAWQAARRAIMCGEWDVVVLDEVNNVLRAGLLDTREVVDALRKRPPHVEVVCTGRGAPAELIEVADLVTEARCVKHPYQRGVQARRGIEY